MAGRKKYRERNKMPIGLQLPVNEEKTAKLRRQRIGPLSETKIKDAVESFCKNSMSQTEFIIFLWHYALCIPNKIIAKYTGLTETDVEFRLLRLQNRYQARYERDEAVVEQDFAALATEYIKHFTIYIFSENHTFHRFNYKVDHLTILHQIMKEERQQRIRILELSKGNHEQKSVRLHDFELVQCRKVLCSLPFQYEILLYMRYAQGLTYTDIHKHGIRYATGSVAYVREILSKRMGLDGVIDEDSLRRMFLQKI